MFLKFKLCITFFIAIVDLGIYGEACDIHDERFGCKIDDAKCYCDFGCRSEFPYINLQECEAANLAKNGNRFHCSNGGKYFENAMGGFGCDCTGTDYYGVQCSQKRMPPFDLFECFNHGMFVESSLGGFGCNCMGTGYYGVHCENKEPALE